MTRIEKGKATPLRRPGRQPKGGLHIALPPGVPEMIGDARRGDTRALGRLYGLAGALVRGGAPIPEPLAEVIADRLAALADALLGQDRKDYRQAIAAAAAPWNRRGRKPNTARDHESQEQAAISADRRTAARTRAGKWGAQSEAASAAALSVGTIRRAQKRNRAKMGRS